MPNLEDVFKVSGVPTHTYVTPDRYGEIKVAIRTAGRCVVLEGPSGIGKTTIITKVLSELEFTEKPTVLSGRKKEDIEVIEALPEMKDFGTVIIDDFHRLADEIKNSLSDYLKVLAETDESKDKIILIGINKAGDQLVQYGRDLGLRIDIFGLEANSPEKILELIELGEKALNVKIEQRELIAERSQGSFQTAQLLCHKICAKNDITESCKDLFSIETPVEGVIDDAMADLGRQFKDAALAFARGTKIRREGKAPYLHILKWLSESDEGSVDLTEAMNTHPDQKQSVGQVVKKGFLTGLLNDPEKTALFDPILFGVYPLHTPCHAISV